MAGGKETPRQKMIGMMYLVLTALLALNVSKEIIRAFVTINDKLDASGMIIEQTSGAAYDMFGAKRSTLIAQKADTETVDFWMDKSVKLKKRTRQIVHFILSESNEMIKEAEGGVDWVEERGEEDNLIETLRPLLDVSAMDNYDIPTNRFIGGNPKQPKHKEGFNLIDSIHAYRNYVVEMMGTYPVGTHQWEFTAPEDTSGLEDALKTANPEDHDRIKQFYKAITVPKEIEVKEAGQVKSLPWASVMFDHAPIVAAAAMLTSIKVDVLSAENIAIEYMLAKVDVIPFSFNKIDPLPFAKSSYINPGDSMGLKVMIAAYDSTDIPEVRYAVNADTLKEISDWETIKSRDGIGLPNNSAGDYYVKGQIAVKEKGQKTWKDWNFRYTVGSPSGTVSLPDMRVLYKGFENKVEGAASGFPNYDLTASSNVRLTKSGDHYIAIPSGGRTAKINILGVADDGSKANIGTFDFDVRPLPPAQIYFGKAGNGEKASRAETRLFAKYPPEITLNAKFSITSWELEFMGRAVQGGGNQLTPQAQALLGQAQAGATASFLVKYRGPDGGVRNGAVTVKL